MHIYYSYIYIYIQWLRQPRHRAIGSKQAASQQASKEANSKKAKSKEAGSKQGSRKQASSEQEASVKCGRGTNRCAYLSSRFGPENSRGPRGSFWAPFWHHFERKGAESGRQGAESGRQGAQ